MKVTITLDCSHEVGQALIDVCKGIEATDRDIHEGCISPNGGGGGRSGKPESKVPYGDRLPIYAQKRQQRALRDLERYIVRRLHRVSEMTAYPVEV